MIIYFVNGCCWYHILTFLTINLSKEYLGMNLGGKSTVSIIEA